MPVQAKSTKLRGTKKLLGSLSRQWSTKLWDLSDRANRKHLWGFVCRRQATADATACLRALLPQDVPITADTVHAHLEELAQQAMLQDWLAAQRQQVKGRLPLPTLSDEANTLSLLCYVALRLLRPATVVETGCATGWMSALMLSALHKNQHGRLISIDLPPVAGQLSMEWTMPEGLSIGFLVPPALRDRWTLMQGNTRVELIPLLERLGSIDVFFHDSDHSYVHMMWEYTTAWPYLSERGLLLSDDIGWHTAFWDFATAVGCRPVIHRSNTNVGALSRKAAAL